MNNSIGLELKGGLGNQLFQTFTLISKAIDTNKDFYILHRIDNKRPLYKFIFFNIIDKITSENYNINYNFPHFYIEKKVCKFDEIPNDSLFIGGYFKHYKYFDHNKIEIIKLLKLNELQEKYKFPFKKIIAIHLRFEDIIINNNNIATPSYYIKCLNILKDELKEDFYNHKLIIFNTKGEYDERLTDEFIKKINLELENPLEFIKFSNLYPNVNTEEEFFYMSNCNYFITNISTFCWFAFYLSNYNQKRLFTILDEEFMKMDGITILTNDTYKSNEILTLLNPN
jgi:hypothetical protein